MMTPARQKVLAAALRLRRKKQAERRWRTGFITHTNSVESALWCMRNLQYDIAKMEPRFRAYRARVLDAPAPVA